MNVESDAPARGEAIPGLSLRLFGPLAVTRDGIPVSLPPSRKVRALLAYLALAPRPVMRSRLCELLWDRPSDPRGELRWCLSKLRRILDEPERRRVQADADAIALDLSDCRVDAVEVEAALRDGGPTGRTERLRRLAGVSQGEFLEGLEMDRSPTFAIWLAARRRHFGDLQVSLLAQAAEILRDEEAIPCLERWVELAPGDVRPHAMLLGRLAQTGRLKEGSAHLDAALRHFKAEDLDGEGLRVAWNTARRNRSARATAAPSPSTTRRASLAVMPFADPSPGGGADGLADGLTHDVIMGLARLRSLLVIAPGSVLPWRERSACALEADRASDVDYVVTGSVHRHDGGLCVRVEMAEPPQGRVVWADSFEASRDGVLALLEAIRIRIVSLVSQEIEANESQRAIRLPPHALDARGAYHRALWHLYRFTRADNETARTFFARAIDLDPTFSRAHAGLSSTHFQNAFQSWAPRSDETVRALDAAEEGLLADDRDPAAHWALGRALWLFGRQESAIAELERAVELSPNFAQGYYALAFVHAQSGDPATAVACSDESRRLSPSDPMLFAMLGARAMALVRMGQFEEAAAWSVRAAAQPNAHAQIQAIAAFTLALADREHDALGYLTRISHSLPRYGIGDFLTAMHFSSDGEELFRDGARRVGLA
ncbi:MAG: tetratricopeptide repeat protein [Microvirga sp.]